MIRPARSRLSVYLSVFISVIAFALACAGRSVAAETTSPSNNPSPTKATTLNFGGVDYFHRWSKNGQNEFTPQGQTDFSHWRDMMTINVYDNVHNGAQLAESANRVLANYQSHGKILRTDSKPRTSQREAEHLIVAVLGSPEFLEAVFTRVVLVDGVGIAIVYSHRVYGKNAGDPAGAWLKSQGPTIERTLMAWDKIPPPSALKQLPQSL